MEYSAEELKEKFPDTWALAYQYGLVEARKRGYAEVNIHEIAERFLAPGIAKLLVREAARPNAAETSGLAYMFRSPPDGPARTLAVLSSPESWGREEQAVRLLVATWYTLSVEQIIARLSVMPRGEPRFWNPNDGFGILVARRVEPATSNE